MLCYSAPATLDLSNEAAAGGTNDHPFYRDDSKVEFLTPATGRSNQSDRTKYNSYLDMAIIVLVCFNPLFGALSVYLSFKSNKDFEQGKLHGAHVKGKASLVISVCGIIISLLAIFLAIFLPLLLKGN